MLSVTPRAPHEHPKAPATTSDATWRFVFRFDCPKEERGFVEAQRPRVATRTIAFHALAAGLRVVALLVSVAGNAWASQRPAEIVDVRACAGDMVLVAFQVFVCLSLAALWRTRWGSRAPWETMSVALAALSCAASQWAGALPSATLPGVDAADLGDDEGVPVVLAAMTAVGYCVLVPCRISAWPAVPVAALGSYLALVAIWGSQDLRTVPLKVALLALLLVLPLGSQRRLEQLERERWSLEHTRAMSPPEQSLPQVQWHITCSLSESCALTKTVAAVHDTFFGRRAEGLAFTSILPRADRLRFQEVLEEAALDGASSDKFTLNLPRGTLSVDIYVAPAEDYFIMGLTVLDERPCQVVRIAVPCEDEDYSLSRVPSVPEHDLFAGELPGVVLEEEYSGEVCVQPAKSDRSSSRRRTPTSDDGSSVSRPRLLMQATRSARSEISRLTDDSLCLSGITDDRPSQDIPERAGAKDSFTGMRRCVPTLVTQTGSLPKTSIDAAVNTLIVMDEFSFRCTACSKPPKTPSTYTADGFAPVVPGPEAQALIAKLDRKKGVKRSRRRSSKRSRDVEGVRLYSGSDFNGHWEASGRDRAALNPWLQVFIILDGRVLLGDASEAQLVQVGESGPVLLCGGRLHISERGSLVRVGQSGVELEFVRVGNVVWEDIAPSSDDEDERTSFQATSEGGSSSSGSAGSVGSSSEGEASLEERQPEVLL